MNESEENATFLDRLTIATSPAILKITRAKRDVILAVMIEPTFSLETPPPPDSSHFFLVNNLIEHLNFQMEMSCSILKPSNTTDEWKFPVQTELQGKIRPREKVVKKFVRDCVAC